MAKILGGIAGGLTIAGLFRTSFEIIDIIHFTRNQKPDYEKLRLRLMIEKCRLRAWGESMGVYSATQLDRTRPIDDLRFPEAVREILSNIIVIFDGAEEIKNKYGYSVRTSIDSVIGSSGQPTINELPVSFSTLPTTATYMSPTRQIKQTVTWVISDRRRFATLIEEIKELTDRLKEITASDTSVNTTVQLGQEGWSPGFLSARYGRPKL